MFELITRARFDETSATGTAAIGSDVPWLADHFPGAPLLPGSIQIELCAQIAGPLAESIDAAGRWAFLAMVRHATFPAPCALPAEVAVAAEFRRRDGDTMSFATACRRDGVQICRAEIVMALVAPEATWAPAIAEARARRARWQR
jgi:3-hydroxymyristoyl/3-hydroxydecanoyl-(acyl carrier protein) dehydratase